MDRRRVPGAAELRPVSPTVWRIELLGIGVRIALVIALVFVANRAVGDEKFGLTYSEDPRGHDPNQILVRGTVVNDNRRAVLNVYVTAEALNSAGRVIATGVAYVSPSIEESRSAPFVIKVPRVEGISRFRVMVSSFRYGLGVHGP